MLLSYIFIFIVRSCYCHVLFIVFRIYLLCYICIFIFTFDIIFYGPKVQVLGPIFKAHFESIFMDQPKPNSRLRNPAQQVQQRKAHFWPVFLLSCSRTNLRMHAPHVVKPILPHDVPTCTAKTKLPCVPAAHEA